MRYDPTKSHPFTPGDEKQSWCSVCGLSNSAFARRTYHTPPFASPLTDTAAPAPRLLPDPTQHTFAARQERLAALRAWTPRRLSTPDDDETLSFGDDRCSCERGEKAIVNCVHLREFRVPAAVVHSHLIDLLINERRTFGTRSPETPAPIKRMILIGGRYAPSPGGALDSSGSTPEDLTLARELAALIVKRLGVSPDKFDMAKWSDRAMSVIDRAERPDAQLNDLGSDLVFTREQLVPVLATIADLPPEPVTE